MGMIWSKISKHVESGCACSSVDRVPGYEPVGRRFESCQARQQEKDWSQVVFQPFFCILIKKENACAPRLLLGMPPSHGRENHRGRKRMQKVVYISNSRDFTEENDINDNQYLVRLNKLLEEGWVIAQMNTKTVDVDPKLESYLHKETLVSFVILEKPE